MTDLHDLLERACEGDSACTSNLAAADLTRGRTALRRRRSVQAASTLAGVAAVGALGYAVVPRSDSNGSTTAQEPTPTSTPTTTAPEHKPKKKATPERPDPGPIVLARSSVSTPYFTFGVLPKGWDVWMQDENVVEISFGGKNPGKDGWLNELVVMFDPKPGETKGLDPIQHNGRTFWVRHRSAKDGMDTVYVASRAGEPGWGVEIQYPQSAGFSDQQMLEFADSVHVLPGAVGGS